MPPATRLLRPRQGSLGCGSRLRLGPRGSRSSGAHEGEGVETTEGSEQACGDQPVKSGPGRRQGPRLQSVRGRSRGRGLKRAGARQVRRVNRSLQRGQGLLREQGMSAEPAGLWRRPWKPPGDLEQVLRDLLAYGTWNGTEGRGRNWRGPTRPWPCGDQERTWL